MAVLSLGLHAIVLLVVFLAPSTPASRPPAAYEVSLVAVPTPVPIEPDAAASPAEPEVVAPAPAPRAELSRPAPAPPQGPAVVTEPKAPSPPTRREAPAIKQPTAPPRQEHAPPTPPSPRVAQESVSRPPAATAALPRMSEPPRGATPTIHDLLKGVELPPDAPKFSELSNASPTVKETDQPSKSPSSDLEKLLSRITVPETPTPPPPTQTARQESAGDRSPTPARPSLSEELLKQLQAVQQQAQTAAPSLPAARPTQESPATVASKPPAKQRQAVIRAEGGGPGLTQYLQTVQRLISRAWAPPYVESSGQPVQVVVRFRLHRDGRISDVVVEQPSGNEYYDLAGQRAVRQARLPEFPAEMRTPYVEAHFSFTVEEHAGG